MASPPPVVAEGLSKRYGRTTALDGLDLRIDRGEVYGLLGPNGAGKTTTIRLLLGLHRPSAGSASLFGVDAWRDAAAAHRKVAYVSGDPALWPSLTGAETLEFLAATRGGDDRDRRRELIARFRLDVDKRVRALSKGNRQKVQLVAAFATRVPLLILDEPTGGLDPLMEAVFRDTVREAVADGATVLLSSHVLSEVEALCGRIGILRDGRLVDEGSLAGLRHLGAQVLEVSFDGAPPVLPRLPGATVTAVDASTVHIEVAGELAPVLRALADLPVARLTAREPSLEEIFLHHYSGAPEP